MGFFVYWKYLASTASEALYGFGITWWLDQEAGNY